MAYLMKKKIGRYWKYQADDMLCDTPWTHDPQKALYHSKPVPVGERVSEEKYVRARYAPTLSER